MGFAAFLRGGAAASGKTQTFRRMIDGILPLKPKRTLVLLGDPRDFRAQKKLKRRLMGCRWPRTCPTCRQFTRQWWTNKAESVWYCGSCQHTYRFGKIVEHRLTRRARLLNNLRAIMKDAEGDL